MQTTPNFPQQLATSNFFRSWMEQQPPGRVFRDGDVSNPLATWLNDTHPDHVHFIQPGFVLVRRLDSRRPSWEADMQIELPDWACDFDLVFQFEIVDKTTGTATAREILNLWKDV